MNSRRFALSFLALTAIASSQGAFAMGKKPVAYRLTEVSQAGQSFGIQASDAKNATVSLTPGETGCVKLVRGANLAGCLVSCDGSASLTVAKEPVYADVYRETELERFSGNLERQIQADPDTVITVRPGSRKGRPARLLAPKAADALCSPAARAAFDADACLAQTGRAIFASDADPLTAYRLALSNVVARGSTPLAAPVESARTGLLARLGTLETELAKAGLTGFLRTGQFASQNLKNAAALICQLESRVRGLDGPSQALETALTEDGDELDRSIDFLSRYNAANGR